MIVIFEGHERSGKSTIAKKLSEILDIEVYVPPERGKQLDMVDTSNEYDEAVELLNLIYSNGEDIIFDRLHGSERVYSAIFNRKTDMAGFYRIERMLKNKFDTFIILCYKDDNAVEADGKISRDTNIAIKNEFFKFFTETTCKILLLNTTCENTEEQVVKIINFLKGNK